MEGNEGNLNNQGMGEGGSANSSSSGDTNPTWMAQLPDTYKSNETLRQFKTIGDLSGKFLDLNGKVGNALSVPGDNASAEEWATFYNKTGRPESPEKYQLENPQAPEWFQHDKEGEGHYRKWAHETGLSQRAAASLYKSIVNASLEEAKEIQGIIVEHRTKAENSLKDLWKNDYPANIELSKRGLERSAKHFLGEETGTRFAKFVHDAHLSDDPMFVQFFHALGHVMESDKTAFGSGFSGQGGQANKYNQTDRAGRPMLDFSNTPSMKR